MGTLFQLTESDVQFIALEQLGRELSGDELAHLHGVMLANTDFWYQFIVRLLKINQEMKKCAQENG